LRTRAARSGVDTRVIHAATIATAAASSSGLHYYKFSTTITITKEAVNKLPQPYHTLHQNLLKGAHTLVLLEYDVQGALGVTPVDAMGGLLLAEENFQRGVVGTSTFALVMSRIGRQDATQIAGTFAELSKLEFGEPPHSIIIPGKLHFTEVESVSALFKLDESKVKSNSDEVLRTAHTLVPKYIVKTRRALDTAKAKLGPQYDAVIENAELYTKDAENFLANDQDELAMLSIGYAEGLVDSLSLAGVAKIDW